MIILPSKLLPVKLVQLFSQGKCLVEKTRWEWAMYINAFPHQVKLEKFLLITTSHGDGFPYICLN